MFQLVKALKRERWEHPWRIAFSIVRSQFWFHRTYILLDHDGFKYDPMVLQWRFAKWLLWENKKEIDRQRRKERQN